MLPSPDAPSCSGRRHSGRERGSVMDSCRPVHAPGMSSQPGGRSRERAASGLTRAPRGDRGAGRRNLPGTEEEDPCPHVRRATSRAVRSWPPRAWAPPRCWCQACGPRPAPPTPGRGRTPSSPASRCRPSRRATSPLPGTAPPATAGPTATAAIAQGDRGLPPGGRRAGGRAGRRLPHRRRSPASNVNLYLAKGATLRFSTDPGKYLPVVLTRYEGIECLNYSPLIYAYEQQKSRSPARARSTGRRAGRTGGVGSRGGVGLDKGHAPPGAGQPEARAQGEAGVPVAQRVYGAGHYLRPHFIQPYRCSNVLIEGVTVRNAPFWTPPGALPDVTIRDVTVASQGPNNDGCDPESCNGVLIEAATSTPRTTASRSSRAAAATGCGARPRPRTSSSGTPG